MAGYRTSPINVTFSTVRLSPKSEYPLRLTCAGKVERTGMAATSPCCLPIWKLKPPN